MNRYVYLYELDSVRNNPEEIELGQAALFEEIVKNGNTVVLAFNQLTDSEAFLSAVRDKDTYKSIVELFTMGALKVSQFGETRTASQYMQKSIEKCLGTEGDKFLFSGVPVLCTDSQMLKLIGNALKYSDVGILKQRAEEETDADEKERLEYIERFIRMILLLSVEEPAGHPAKQAKRRGFTEFYVKICQILRRIVESDKSMKGLSGSDSGGCNQNIYMEEIKKLLPKSLRILSDIEKDMGDAQRNNRTNWVNRINDCKNKTDSHCLAEAIVDLCYNYTVEDSIYEISKHYLENDSGDEYGKFEDDFLQRILEYWKLYKLGVHTFCKGDKEERAEFEVSLPHWDTAVRVLRNTRKLEMRRQGIQKWKRQMKGMKKQEGNEEQRKKERGQLYEEHYFKERKQWRIRLISQMGARFGTALIYIALFCLADLGINLAEESLFETVLWLQPRIIPQAVWDIIYSTILFGVIGSAVAEIFHLQDILESLKGIVTGIRDSYRIIITPRNQAYYNVFLSRTNLSPESDKK